MLSVARNSTLLQCRSRYLADITGRGKDLAYGYTKGCSFLTESCDTIDGEGLFEGYFYTPNVNKAAASAL